MKNVFIGLSTLLLVSLAAPSYGQQLQAAGVSGSFNIARLHTQQAAFEVSSVILDPQSDQSDDETGNGLALFGRWQVGSGGWYAQPEVGYLSTLETPVLLSAASGSYPYASRRIRRLEARLLGGYRIGPLRVFAGPSVGYALFTAPTNFRAADLAVRAAINALDAARPPRVQAAGQAGAGLSLWRFDVNVRYEWGLTAYTRTIRWQQETFDLHRTLQQLVLEVGFQVYQH